MMTQKNAENFICEKCHFVCSKKSNYEKHLLTRKHKNDDKKEQKSPQNYDCDCGKSFKYRQGLYVHKKSCKMDKNIDIISDVDTINDGKKIEDQNDTQN